MAAPKSNKNGTKLKEKDIRQEAYEQYCKWIASGRGKEGWTFIHPELSCTYKTMERYMRENPIEFPAFKKELADAESFKTWEARGVNMMEGKAKSETALYQMFMRNKFGWDKENREHKDSNEPDFRRALFVLEKKNI